MDREKSYEEMSERELMAALLEGQDKMRRNSLVTAIACVVLALVLMVCSAVLVPKWVFTMEKMNNTMGDVQDTVQDVRASLVKANEAIDNIDKVVVDNTDAVTEAIGKISDIDIESLNESIRKMSEVIEPLANFLGLFKGNDG